MKEVMNELCEYLGERRYLPKEGRACVKALRQKHVRWEQVWLVWLEQDE